MVRLRRPPHEKRLRPKPPKTVYPEGSARQYRTERGGVVLRVYPSGHVFLMVSGVTLSLDRLDAAELLSTGDFLREDW